MTQTKPTLFVCVPSAQADRTEAGLCAMGLVVTRADNVCVAELFAEAQHFEVAVYDQSLRPEEQVSLAQVMRIRWAWMKIIRFVSSARPVSDESLFDCTAHTESQLTTCLAMLDSP